jgi:hypothetical protein
VATRPHVRREVEVRHPFRPGPLQASDQVPAPAAVPRRINAPVEFVGLRRLSKLVDQVLRRALTGTLAAPSGDIPQDGNRGEDEKSQEHPGEIPVHTESEASGVPARKQKGPARAGP